MLNEQGREGEERQPSWHPPNAIQPRGDLGLASRFVVVRVLAGGDGGIQDGLKGGAPAEGFGRGVQTALLWQKIGVCVSGS